MKLFNVFFASVKYRFPRVTCSNSQMWCFQVHVLWWTTICNWLAALRSHSCRHGERRCDTVGSSEWISRWTTVRLGLPWLTSGMQRFWLWKAYALNNL